MLHVHGVVHRLGETAGDRLRDSKQAIEKLRPEKRVMNEVVPHPIDVRIHHQRINEPENQHHRQRRMRQKKIKDKKVSAMKQPSGRRQSVPACVREKLRVCRWAFYANHVSTHRANLNVKYSPQITLGKFEDCQRPFSLTKLGALNVRAST